MQTYYLEFEIVTHYAQDMLKQQTHRRLSTGVLTMSTYHLLKLEMKPLQW